MSFGVQVDNPALVDRAEVYFSDANQSEAMTQTASNTWGRTRTMQQAGTNRPFEVRVYQKGTTTVVRRNGVYSVQATPPPPPPRPPAPTPTPTLSIHHIDASPSSVRVGQQMTFSVEVVSPALVDRVELYFSDVDVVESLSQVGANTWADTRTMGRAGANRPYEIRVYRRGGGILRRTGTYTVR